MLATTLLLGIGASDCATLASLSTVACAKADEQNARVMLDSTVQLASSQSDKAADVQRTQQAWETYRQMQCSIEAARSATPTLAQARCNARLMRDRITDISSAMLVINR